MGWGWEGVSALYFRHGTVTQVGMHDYLRANSGGGRGGGCQQFRTVNTNGFQVMCVCVKERYPEVISQKEH